MPRGLANRHEWAASHCEGLRWMGPTCEVEPTLAESYSRSQGKRPGLHGGFTAAESGIECWQTRRPTETDKFRSPSKQAWASSKFVLCVGPAHKRHCSPFLTTLSVFFSSFLLASGWAMGAT